MSRYAFTLLCLVLLALFAYPAGARSTAQLADTLMDHYDDGSEMNQRIIAEFLGSRECERQCGGWSQ